MSTLMIAIKNIVENYNINVATAYDTNNRMNRMGYGLENYIKDLFSDVTTESTEEEKTLKQC